MDIVRAINLDLSKSSSETMKGVPWDVNPGDAEVLNTLYEICHYKEYKNYFAIKYNDVPHITEIIDILQYENISSRNIDVVLNAIKLNMKVLVQAKIGTELTSKIYSILHPYESGKHAYKEVSYNA